MKQKLAVLLVGAGAFLAGTRAYAHHSLSATYYADKEVKLDGKIEQILLRNPHSFLQVDAPDEAGVMQRWSLEWRVFRAARPAGHQARHAGGGR